MHVRVCVCAPLAGSERYSEMEHQTKSEKHSAPTIAGSNLFILGYPLVIPWLTKSISKMGVFRYHVTKMDDTCETCGHSFFNQLCFHV